MRIIFQNGEIAELTNVDKIVVYNPGEIQICKDAISDYYIADLKDQLGIKEDSDEHSSSKASSYGSLSKYNLAQEGSQYAGQTGVCDLPISSRKEEAGGSDTTRYSGRYRFPVQ